ncbi:hypothetical protein BHE74_00011371 [Ensete ventricosum]|nr:hypothetical protein GW17_00041316 [Ensete ventricosum]RWW80293.1 hypothetical protein BHE74_00011371 [Ensete ventricosum]RZS09043.1 hypothetical protein BHM03_00040100 [Ensete ventricosum]
MSMLLPPVHLLQPSSTIASYRYCHCPHLPPAAHTVAQPLHHCRSTAFLSTHEQQHHHCFPLPIHVAVKHTLLFPFFPTPL